MNDNFCVNFYDKTLSLYINGILLAIRKVIVLQRGTPENEDREYKCPIDNRGRSMLTDVFNIGYSKTLFKHRLYFEPYFCVWMLGDGYDALFHYDRLYEDDIKDLTVKIEYEPCGESVSMKELLSYPADLVIDYLKERGITSCPLLPDSLR